MARKTRAEQLTVINEKLDSSARWRDELGYDNLWRRMVDLYRGRHWPRTTASREDLIAVNIAFSTVNVIAPAVSVNHPKIVVVPNKPEDEDRAVFVEAVVNHLWRHHDFRTPFRRSVKDFLIFGHGWLKVGWKFLEQERMLGESERDELFAEAMIESDVFAMENPDMAGELPDDEQMAASIPTTSMAVVEDQPFVERVSPYDIYIDPEATCVEDAKWIAQRIVVSLEEAKKDRRYKPSARKNLEATSLLNPMYAPTDRQETNQYLSGVIERTVIYEFYDIANNTMSVMAKDTDEFLVDPMPMPYAYGQPFVMLRNYDVPDHFYPMGDLEAIESLQLELDKTRSQLMNARKRYARKYLYHERSFGPEGREALESDDDKLATIEISIGHVARRVVQLMQQYMTGEQMAQVSAAGGETLFVPYSRDDIVGEYDFSVEGGSTQPMNETIRKQQAVSLMNAVAPLVGIVIDPAALAKYVLQTGFGIKNPEKFIMQQQTPQDAEAAQAEAGAAPMPFGQAPIPEGPDMGAFAPTGGVPPELLAQLQGQMGLELPQL